MDDAYTRLKYIKKVNQDKHKSKDDDGLVDEIDLLNWKDIILKLKENILI